MVVGVRGGVEVGIRVVGVSVSGVSVGILVVLVLLVVVFFQDISLRERPRKSGVANNIPKQWWLLRPTRQ